MVLIDNKQMLGKLGESLVMKYFVEKNCKVIPSVDQFDKEKDLIVDNEKFEIKTQVLWKQENAFTVERSQLTKCRNVSRLIWIEVPTPFSSENTPLYILEDLPIEKRQFRLKKTKNGKVMYLRDKKQMTLLETITDVKIISQAKRFSSSEYKGK